MTADEILEKGHEVSQLRAPLETDKIAKSIAEALWEIAEQLAIINERKMNELREG